MLETMHVLFSLYSYNGSCCHNDVIVDLIIYALSVMTLSIPGCSVELSPRTFMQKLGGVYEPLQLTTLLHESQDPSLLDLLPEKIEIKKVFPTEVMALSWVLQQPKCCVTTLQ